MWKTGSITPDKDADLIVDVQAENLLPSYDFAASPIGAGHPANVKTVIVAGRVVKQKAGLVGVALGDVRSRA